MEGEFIRRYRPLLNTQIPHADDWHRFDVVQLDEGKLLAVASAVPGAGERVMNTLMSLDEGGRLCLEVASTNERAIRLYERLGFIKTREISCWYRVFG